MFTELIYCGVILDDESLLSSCGVKTGVTIHVLEKKTTSPPIPVKPLTEVDVQQLVTSFRKFTLTLGYRTALQRLSQFPILQNVMAATPGLADDPVALSIIRDPELIVQLSDPDTVRRMAELHPTLIEAAKHISAQIHEEANNILQHQPSTSTGYSYSLEALEDDEEMESPNESQEGAPLTRNASFSAITATQLAAAIANATGTSIGLSGSSTGGNVVGTPTSSNNLITSEMFSNAMQHAFASSQSVTTPTGRNATESFEAITAPLQPQLQQMREIGLGNEAVNIRALQTTSGDVQAAIELVLSGAFD